MSIPQENLRRDLRGRLDTDKQMSAIWAIVPLLPIIIGLLTTISLIALTFSVPATATSSTIVLSLFGLLSLLFFGYFTFFIPAALMVFFLVRRRNSHFNRQILLYEDLVGISKELASKKSVDVSLLTNNMDRSLREARLEEVEKNATLWALISFSFPLGPVYSGYFLLKDFYKHERREDLFIQDLLRTLYQLGVPINLPYRNPPIPDRSFALYFVLTLFDRRDFWHLLGLRSSVGP